MVVPVGAGFDTGKLVPVPISSSRIAAEAVGATEAIAGGTGRMAESAVVIF